MHIGKQGGGVHAEDFGKSRQQMPDVKKKQGLTGALLLFQVIYTCS